MIAMSHSRELYRILDFMVHVVVVVARVCQRFRGKYSRPDDLGVRGRGGALHGPCKGHARATTSGSGPGGPGRPAGQRLARGLASSASPAQPSPSPVPRLICPSRHLPVAGRLGCSAHTAAARRQEGKTKQLNARFPACLPACPVRPGLMYDCCSAPATFRFASSLLNSMR